MKFSKTSISKLSIAAAIPLAAIPVQWIFWTRLDPYAWLLLYPAVFVSSWVGSLIGGLIATAISIISAIYLFLPPPLSFTIEDPHAIFSMIVFAIMGGLFSFTQDRLQKQEREQMGKLERSLLESEERYQVLFEQNLFGLLILDPETTCPLVFNEQVCRQLGFLLKPGVLTEEEMAVMRKHPIYAWEFLSPIHYLKSAAVDIPYCHHEKWDGSGYLRGLKGEEIPQSARLFAIVDVWDALINDRTIGRPGHLKCPGLHPGTTRKALRPSHRGFVPCQPERNSR